MSQPLQRTAMYSANEPPYDASFFFKADKKRVLATLRVNEEVGGNIDSVVKSFCASEGLPPQTRLYLRAAAWALENECNERGPLLQEAFEMLPGSIEDVDVYSKKLWKEKALAPRVSSPQDEAFSNAYRLSVNDKTLLENMIYMEHMYSKALYELIKARDSTDNNEYLAEYEKEILQTINDQRKGYQEFVIAQAAEIIEGNNNDNNNNNNITATIKHENNIQQSTTNTINSNNNSNNHRSNNKRVINKTNLYLPRRVWKERGIFLERFEEMDVLKTGINNLYLGKNVEKMKARKLKQEQEQNRKNKSKNGNNTNNIQICLGRQHKMTYDIILEDNEKSNNNTLENILIFPIHNDEESLHLRKKHAVQLYSNNQLQALIVPLELNGNLNDGVIYSCNATTEMHFERIEEQFQYALKKYYGSEIKDNINDNDDKKVDGQNNNTSSDELIEKEETIIKPGIKHAYFNAGEVLVTRHSNLNNIHVIFHIVPVEMEVIYDKINDRFKMVRKIKQEDDNNNFNNNNISNVNNIDTDQIRKALEKIISYSNVSGIHRLYVANDLSLSLEFERTMRLIRTSLLHVISEVGDRRVDLKCIHFLQLLVDDNSNGNNNVNKEKANRSTNINKKQQQRTMNERMNLFFQHDM